MSAAVHVIRDGRFVCLAGTDAKCRNYPACDCEVWSREVHGQQFGQVIGTNNGHWLYASETIPPTPGHEDVPQGECWIDGWMNAGALWECYDPDEVVRDDDDFPDGPIDTEWHGDYLTWHYADQTRPIDRDEDA